jgi:hypothetical protein
MKKKCKACLMEQTDKFMKKYLKLIIVWSKGKSLNIKANNVMSTYELYTAL